MTAARVDALEQVLKKQGKATTNHIWQGYRKVHSGKIELRHFHHLICAMFEFETPGVQAIIFRVMFHVEFQGCNQGLFGVFNLFM